jgi:large subunit ribosomal protein L4
MMIDIIKLDNSLSERIEIADEIFSREVRKDILHRMVRWQLAKRRAGTHKVKEKSEVSLTTKKNIRQKGSGSARHGSRKAVQFRGGGVVHGPRVRKHEHSLTKKFRKIALKTALSLKAKEKKLIVLDSLQFSENKTKKMVSTLLNLGWKSALVIHNSSVNSNFIRSSSNIPNIDTLPQIGTNVYDIMNHETLVITKSAVKSLEGRL